MLTQSAVWYCCSTVLVPLQYCYDTVTVQSGYGSVRFETVIYYAHTLTCLQLTEPHVCPENEQTLIPTPALVSQR